MRMQQSDRTGKLGNDDISGEDQKSVNEVSKIQGFKI